MRAFRDRTEAGRRLAERLTAYRESGALVLGVPRGGVMVAVELAQALGLECDVIVSHKLGAPGNPELAIGAVAEQGVLLVDEAIAAALGVPATYLAQERARQEQEIRRRAARFRAGRPFPELAGRTAILVDDGVATGFTTRAAVRAAQQGLPSTIIVAVPVAAPESLQDLRQEADEVVCLYAPYDFFAVGLWYEEFPQVSDEEATAALEYARQAWVQARRRPAA